MPRMGVMVALLRQRECEAEECKRAAQEEQSAILQVETQQASLAVPERIETARQRRDRWLSQADMTDEDVLRFADEIRAEAAQQRKTPKPRVKVAARKSAAAKRAGSRRR